ncbi:MAG: DinB family protein [Pedobacter sp.]|jgi:uncharacterized damage-inducible protein DinB
MILINNFLKELENEAQITKKMLSRIPDDKFGWKPHVKSMDIKTLATHIAELPTWVGMVLKTDGLDFAVHPYSPPEVTNTSVLLELLETSLEDARTNLAKAEDNNLLPDWTLRTGDMIHVVSSKEDMIRMTFSQIIHHRAQLGVYLRLLNIPIPGSYGPSADEAN